MCCARTAALQGGYEEQKMNASRDFMQQSLRHVQNVQEMQWGKALKAMQKTRSVAVCDMFQSLSNIAKTVVLLHEEHFCDLCWLTPTKIEKCRFEGSKTCPRPYKMEPRATKNPKKTTNMSQKSARSV